jgi:hypothetical protein
MQDDKKTFVLKYSDQNKYYKIVCNKYIKDIFRHIMNKNYVFWIDNFDGDNFDSACEYLTKNKKMMKNQNSSNIIRHFHCFLIIKIFITLTVQILDSQ